MEKINTPIMAKIKLEKERLDNASIAYHRADSNKDGLGMQLAKNKMIESAHCLSVLKSLLPTERDLIEKAYTDGNDPVGEFEPGIGWPIIDAKDYFTQTFKSYE